MSFGGGFAAGIGAGMGAGIAAGISAGKKRAAADLRDFLQTEQIEMVDRYGKPVELEAVLSQALPETCGSGSKAASAKLTGLLLLGLLALAAVLVAFFLLR